MDHQYLIPANTKRGQLILGWFRPFDLMLFGTGILITLLLLAFMPLNDTLVTIQVAVSKLNMLNIVVEVYEFLTNRQTYRWKGWCYRSVITKTKRKK